MRVLCQTSHFINDEHVIALQVRSSPLLEGGTRSKVLYGAKAGSDDIACRLGLGVAPVQKDSADSGIAADDGKN